MKDLRGKRVLVTGAGGFIGGHLTAALVRAGADVRALVRYNSRGDRGTLDWLADGTLAGVDVTAGDLRDVESVAGAVRGREVVVHLGAQVAIPYSYASPRDVVETNVVGSLNVAQAALTHAVERLVHVSTSEVYGTPRTLPITEEHPLAPQSPYAASKVGADKLMESHHRAFGLRVAIVRPFNTYGPHQSARAVVPAIISQALAGGPVRLGSLHPRRDLTYVDDTVAGILAAATAPGAVGRTVQLGTGHDVSVREVVDLVGELLGRELEVVTDAARVRPDTSEVLRLVSDPSLAADVLGWRAAVGLRAGLERTIAWIRDNAGRYRPREYAV